MKIVLASGSPRRKELLEKHGIAFDILVTDVDENILGDYKPAELATELSRIKAEAAVKAIMKKDVSRAEKLSEIWEKNNEIIVIAADTVVALGGKIYGKPNDNADAINMLSELSGSLHEVITGVTVAKIIRKENARLTYLSKANITKVKFKELTEAEIQDYVNTGESLGKAGSYAIQETGDTFVEYYEGDFENIIGLPTEMVFEMMDEIK
ncbi:MAG: Maf family protein [Anaerovoracaceae bacterium]